MPKKKILIIGLLFFVFLLFFSSFLPLYIQEGGRGVDEKTFFSLLKWKLLEKGKINTELLPFYEKKNYSIDPISLCEEISWEEQKNTCFALLKNDRGFCDKIEDKVNKDDCYFLLSMSNGIYSPEVCEEMETDFKKEDCYSEIAPLLQDVFLCQKAGDYIDGCIFSVAIASGDFSICEKIEMKYSFSKEYRNQCFIKVAEKTKDISICEKKEIKNWKKACQQKVKNSILKERAKNENPLLCGKIKGDDLWGGDLGLSKYAKIDDCYYEVAIAKNDVSICQKIKDQCFQAECIGVLENPFACEKCRNEGCCAIDSFRGICYNKAAISMEDKELCRRGAMGNSKDDCYFELALKIKGIDIDINIY